MAQIPLTALRVFEAVARCGSFKAAAAELCVSQSAISHQIKHLEEWLDRPLFDRTGQRPKLLEHGEILAHSLGRSFQDIGAACQLASSRTRSRALVIAAIPSVAICWLIPRLSDFQTKHPDIAIQIIYAFHGQDIDFNQVDLAFVFADCPPDMMGFHAQLFQSGASVPVCSPEVRESMDLAVVTEAILKAGLLHDSDVNGWVNWLSQAGFDLPPPLNGPVFEDFNLLRAAALLGQGVALCPLALIGGDLASNRLVQLSNLSVNENQNYYLVGRESNDLEAVAARDHFVAWVFESLHRGVEMLDVA